MQTMEITYSSKAYLADESLLATLTIFYDKIFLPHPYVMDPNSIDLYRLPSKRWAEEDKVREYYLNWKEKYHLLFDEGVLENEPCYFGGQSPPRDIIQQVDRELGLKAPFEDHSAVGYNDYLDGLVTLAVHSIYTKKNVPHFFSALDNPRHPSVTSLLKLDDPVSEVSRSTEYGREIFNQALLYRSLPKIKIMDASEILEKRKKVETYRKNYMYFINKKLDSLRDKVNSGIAISNAAELIWNEDIEPDYYQFMEHTKCSFKWISPVKDVIDGFMSIDAKPLTPRFFGQLALAILGGSDAIIRSYESEKKEKYMAMRFIGNFI